MFCAALMLSASILSACGDTDEGSTANENMSNSETSSVAADNTTDSSVSDETSVAGNESLTDSAVSEKAENSILQANPESDFTYSKDSGYITINFYVGDSNVVVIPNEIEGCPVVQIGTIAFNHRNDEVTEVVFPDNLTSIDYACFKNCTNLKSVTLSPYTESIGNEAFYNCTSLEEITIPGSCQYIGVRAFVGCTALKNVVIEDGADGLSYGAFKDCISLESIRIPQSAQTIESIFNGENNPTLKIDGIDADWMTDEQKQALLEGHGLIK
jgi:hypothetical protein